MMTLLLALACTKDSVNPDDYIAQPKPDGGQEVMVTTRDGVDIAADYYAASSAERPLVVFVHMDPTGSSTRDSWPGEMLQPLVDADFSVMVLDRRGAGGSGGVAADAFETVAGAYDIEAVVLRAQELGFSSFGLVGASNGTTSVMDYCALAQDNAWPAPDAFQMLSVVSSTTNNHAIADMPALPGWFGYPDYEADNNEPWTQVSPSDWDFQEYAPGGHGTRMFAAAPDAAPDMTEWLMQAL